MSLESRILLITTTHLAKNPRLVKEITTLKKFYNLQVVFFQTDPSICRFDREIMSSHPQVVFHPINWKKKYYPCRFASTLLQKTLIFIDRILGIKLFPEQQLFAGYKQLLLKCKKLSFDFIHGHNPGALAVSVNLGNLKKTFSGFDLEDYHRGEYEENNPFRALVSELENKYIPKTDQLFAASILIGEKYHAHYPLKTFKVINNVFPKDEFKSPDNIISDTSQNSLKIVWFSQILGNDRGLDTIIKGLQLIKDFKVDFFLYGLYTHKTKEEMSSQLSATNHQLHFFGMVSNSELNSSLSNYHIGIASEIGVPENRQICLTNKIFAYLQSGLFLLASNTKAQSRLLHELPETGKLFRIGHHEDVAEILTTCYHYPNALKKVQENNYQLGQEVLNWEKESEIVLAGFKEILADNATHEFKKLHIAITVDPEIPVPPSLYGGIERIVYMIICELIAKGHEVTLFAHPDSNVPCRLVPWKGKESNSILSTIINTLQLKREYNLHHFDLVHCFSRLAYLSLLLGKNIPKIMSYQRDPTILQVSRANWLAKKNTLLFTGCSNYISKQIADYTPVKTVYNGVDISKYQYQEKVENDAPLMFLGRIEEIKGVHIAVEIALKKNKRLWIAGNIPKEGKTYFRDKIAPFLNDRIQYVGAVNDAQKNEMLGQSLALLMPILWNEPFGIVMAEAMACGTPVLGFKRGSIPEVIKHGFNGFICEDANEMISKIDIVHTLNRFDVRLHAETHFSSRAIINNYLEVYEEIITA